MRMAYSAAEPWAKFTRNTDVPASTSAWIASSRSVAGPIVAMSFVRDVGITRATIAVAPVGESPRP